MDVTNALYIFINSIININIYIFAFCSAAHLLLYSTFSFSTFFRSFSCRSFCGCYTRMSWFSVHNICVNININIYKNKSITYDTLGKKQLDR